MPAQTKTSQTWRYALAGVLGLVLVWPVVRGLGIDGRFSFPVELLLRGPTGFSVGLAVYAISQLMLQKGWAARWGRTPRYIGFGVLLSAIVWFIPRGLGIDDRFSFGVQFILWVLVGAIVGAIVMTIVYLLRPPSDLARVQASR